MSTQFPIARKNKLVVRELADEVLIYDLTRNKALCLNKTAGAVWKLSDGKRTVPEIAADLSTDFQATFDEKVVWIALEQLGRDHLLENRISVPASIAGVTRREQLRSLGKAAAIAGPVVAALSIPRSAAAASCITSGNGPCNAGTHCCSGTGNCKNSQKCN